MVRSGRVLTLTSVAHFINDGNTWLLPVAYAYMAEVHNMPAYLAGVIALAFAGLGALASPLVGWLMDKYGRPLKLIGLGMLLWSLGARRIRIRRRVLQHSLSLNRGGRLRPRISLLSSVRVGRACIDLPR